MRISSEIVGSLLLLLAPTGSNAIAGSPQDQGKAALERFQSHLFEIVDRQPGYTCQANTERTARLASKGKPIARDRVRFVLTAASSGESYSWPAGGRLDKNAVEQIAQGEASGMNGVSGWTRAMPALSASSGTSSGECNVKGRRGVRFEFQTPWASSSYRISVGPRRIVVPFTGSICADAATLDPIELEVRAGLASGPIASVVETIGYGRTRVGEAEALLPVSRELKVTDREGGERLNVTQFSAFQPYSEPAAADTRQSAAEPPVPEGIDLDIKLDTAITFEDSAAGDPFTAQLQSRIHKGRLNAPKGTELNGRIGQLEERFVPEHHYVVGLDLLTLRLDGADVPCRARLTGPELKYDRRPESVTGFGDLQTMPPIWDARGLEIDATDPAARFGVFRVRGNKLKIAPGLHMIWRTLDAGTADKPAAPPATKP